MSSLHIIDDDDDDDDVSVSCKRAMIVIFLKHHHWFLALQCVVFAYHLFKICILKFLRLPVWHADHGSSISIYGINFEK